MLKLTVNPDTIHDTRTFHKPAVTIGSGREEDAHLSIKDDSLQDVHVKISEEKGRYVIYNKANDPFVSLNGLPFGKKPLFDGDRLRIGDAEILIEYSKVVKKQPPQQPPPPVESKEKAVAPPSPAPDANPETAPQDHAPPKEEQSLEVLAFSLHRWKLFAGLLVALIILLTSIGLYTNFRARDRNSQEEKRIAGGIADIAMGLRYARIYHINPDKQSWSDPSFLKSTLHKILPPELSTLAEIDSQGRFIKHPYMLRIYVNNNLNRFIVIAQPAPTLMQWVVHKTAIVVDSSKMELRKINDIKALNRFFATPNPLDGKNGEEIAAFIDQGELMPLPSLAGQKTNWGFSPPAALAIVRPSSANYIYNAPRYYPLGEMMMKKALELLNQPASSEEIAAVRHELQSLSELPDLILYSADGLKMARAKQKALNTIVPDNEFLIGYLKFNDKGIITTSQLVIDEGAKEQLPLPEPQPAQAVRPEYAPTALDTPETDNPFKKIDKSIDINHPLYLKLAALAAARQRALKPLSDEISALISKNTQQATEKFRSQIHTLIESYEKTDKEQQTKIGKSIVKLYQESLSLPFVQFQKYLEATNLLTIAAQSLKQYEKRMGPEILNREQLTAELRKIGSANRLKDLLQKARETSELLTLEKLPVPERLILYQNQAHIRILQQVKELLLNPRKNFPEIEESEDNEATLRAILQYAWVTDQEEADYFIKALHGEGEDEVASGDE